MKRTEIELLRETIGCEAVLETSGFALDAKESTKRAMKYRRGGEIIIVTHSGRGWFDPLSDAKGDIFGLIKVLEGCDFPEGCARIADLLGVPPSDTQRHQDDREPAIRTSLADDWDRRRPPWPGSATWRYLRWDRSLPASIMRTAIAQGLLREGPCGSVWAAHRDSSGAITGWESRGPEWRGFATGGTKTLFRLGPSTPTRFCVTEAAIDAMSLAAIEGMRDATCYLSTGGGWAPATTAALRQLATASNVQLVAATDANSQGDVYADRLRTIAEDAGCGWLRLRPPENDWNEVLKKRERERREMRFGKGGVPHSHRSRQGKLRPAAPALDPTGRDAGNEGRVMKD
jgi:hypothetical protein